MKFLRLILLAFLAAGIPSCHMNENINVKSNGSGKVAINVDMSQAIGLMQAYMSKEELDKKEMVKMDTTILMKDFIDSAQSLPANTKAVMREGSLHVHLDMSGNVFKADMLFPFNSLDQLQTLYTTMNDGAFGSSQILKGMIPGGGGQGMGGGSPDLSQFTGVYEYTIKDGQMSRKLNEDKWKNLQSNPMFAQAKQIQNMGVDITYTTSITLPRPIKKVDNPLAKLSDDKMTVTMSYKVMDVLDHPEEFAYNIEY